MVSEMAAPLIHAQSVSAPDGSAASSAEGKRAGDAALSLVSESDVGVAQIVSATGWSPATVRRRARTLGGRRGPDGAWKFPSVVLEKITTAERVTFGGGSRGAQEPPDLGRRAAAIFERFEEGQSTSRIVRELQEPPDFVAKMREAWLRGYEADRSGIVLTCRTCSKPSDPQCGYCRDCAPHVERLSEEQRRVLADRDVPVAIRCACGRVADAGTCSVCIEEITVAIEGAALVVRVGDRLLKMLPAHPLLAQLAPAAEVPPGPSPTTDGPPPTVATQALVAEAHRLIEQAKAPIPMTEIEE